MDNEKIIFIINKLACILCILISTAVHVEANSFPCGLISCDRSGYDYCVTTPHVSHKEESFCLSCETLEGRCETDDQQSGCEPFQCKEYLMSKYGCTNDSFVTAKVYQPKNTNKICLDLWIVILFSVLFGLVSLLACVLLWQRGGVHTICVFNRATKQRQFQTDGLIPDAPPETLSLTSPYLDNVNIQDETSLKTTVDGSSASDNDTTSNRTNVSEEFKRPSNIPPTNHGENGTKKFAFG